MKSDIAVEIIPASNRRTELSDEDQRVLLGLPAPLRDSQPVIVTDNENIKQKKRLADNAPLRQSGYRGIECACLVLARFVQAVGRVARESDHNRLDELSCSETL